MRIVIDLFAVIGLAATIFGIALFVAQFASDRGWDPFR